MKMETRISTRPFNAIMRARTARPWAERPRVRERKMGVLPIGLTMGNRAPTTRRVFVTRLLNPSCIKAQGTAWGGPGCPGPKFGTFGQADADAEMVFSLCG